MSLRQSVADLLLQDFGKKNPAELRSGDTVRVHNRIREGEKERVQIFEGLVIAVKHGKGLDGTFTVRKMAAGNIGVERNYPLHSPNIVKIERIKTAAVKRSKLYYMRDRVGKAARFNSEVANPASWTELSVPFIDVIEPEVVVSAAEGSVEAEALEEMATEEVAVPTETQEVVAAVEGEALEQEAAAK